MVTFFPQAVSSVAGLLSLSSRLDTPLVWVVKLSVMLLSILEHRRRREPTTREREKKPTKPKTKRGSQHLLIILVRWVGFGPARYRELRGHEQKNRSFFRPIVTRKVWAFRKCEIFGCAVFGLVFMSISYEVIFELSVVTVIVFSSFSFSFSGHLGWTPAT